MMFGGRQVISRSQVVRNERRLSNPIAREIVVGHRKDDYVVEIEVAGFENAHDLQAPQWFALEWDTECLQMSAQKRSIDLGRKLDVAVIQRIAQLDYFGCGDGEKFDALTGIAARAGGVRHPVKYVEQVIRQVAPSGCGTENALQ